jgi:thiamine-monophosphate kinase
VGGDTTQGPLNICITVLGETPPGQALLRSGAQAGDDIYISGTVGDARLALEVFRGRFTLGGDAFERVRHRMECPTPRVALGMALRGIASAAADVSDGLLGDLGHILKASQVGATLDTQFALNSRAVSADLKSTGVNFCLEFSLSGGDDYELVFTAPPHQRAAVQAASDHTHTPVTRIGQVDAQPGLRLLDAQGRPLTTQYHSFDHFA